MNHCLRHFEEPTAAVCRSCEGPFCTRCLVFSFGPKKPPYCVGCALIASGVRNGSLKSNRQRVEGATAMSDAVDAGREPETFDWSRPVHSAQAASPHRSSFSDKRAKRNERHTKRSLFGRRKKDHDHDGEGPTGDGSGHSSETEQVMVEAWVPSGAGNEVRDTRIPAPSQLSGTRNPAARDTRIPAASQLRLAALAALAREM